MRVLSLLISSIFHPAFVSLIGFLLVYSYSGYALYLSASVFWFSLLVIVQFTIIIPLAAVYFLYWRKYISSIELSVRQERPLPLVINLISYTICFFIFRWMHFPSIMIHFLAAIVVSAALSLMVSLKYKISLHMMGWGTLTGVMLAFALHLGLEMHFLLSGIILLSALVATARLWLNEHTLSQVTMAWGGAFFSSFLIMQYL